MTGKMEKAQTLVLALSLIRQGGGDPAAPLRSLNENTIPISATPGTRYAI